MSVFEQARWFAEQVKPYESALRAYLLRRFPSLPDHDDLVQETYLRLLRARSEGRVTHVRGFLFAAARNVAIDLFRRRRTSPVETLDEESGPRPLDEATDIAVDLENRELRERLIEAIVRLPDRCREAMLLRHVDGLSYKEIAARHGVSLETVKTHLSRGLCECMQHMQRQRCFEDAPSVNHSMP